MCEALGLIPSTAGKQKMDVSYVHSPSTRSRLPFIISFLPENDMDSPPNLFLHPATTHGVLPPWTNPSNNGVADTKLPSWAEADTKYKRSLFHPSFHKNSSPLKFRHFPRPPAAPSPVSTTLPPQQYDALSKCMLQSSIEDFSNIYLSTPSWLEDMRVYLFFYLRRNVPQYLTLCHYLAMAFPFRRRYSSLVWRSLQLGITTTK